MSLGTRLCTCMTEKHVPCLLRNQSTRVGSKVMEMHARHTLRIRTASIYTLASFPGQNGGGKNFLLLRDWEPGYHTHT